MCWVLTVKVYELFLRWDILWIFGVFVFKTCCNMQLMLTLATKHWLNLLEHTKIVLSFNAVKLISKRFRSIWCILTARNTTLVAEWHWGGEGWGGASHSTPVLPLLIVSIGDIVYFCLCFFILSKLFTILCVCLSINFWDTICRWRKCFFVICNNFQIFRVTSI